MQRHIPMTVTLLITAVTAMLITLVVNVVIGAGTPLVSGFFLVAAVGLAGVLAAEKLVQRRSRSAVRRTHVANR